MLFLQSSCLFVAILASVSGVVYKPCELVEAIKNVITPISASQLPLIACIAGYRKYNTSYRLEHPKNQTGYYGIFGLYTADVDRTQCAGPAWNISNLTDDDIENDLQCLQSIILESPINLEFFERMCSPSMVRNVPCPITNYVQANVFDPLDKTLFEKAFQKGGLPNPPPMPTPSTVPPCCCGESVDTSNYWAFYITVPAIIIVLAFFAFRIAMKRRRQVNQEASLINP